VQRGHILDEIRRCAADNGGVPLGIERVAAETGIVQTAWAGKYWVRWNDALEEAGFPPNRMNQPLPDDHLLRHLALLVRDLGRFPVAREIRMRRREDSDFPSANTFSQLGDKQAVIARLAEYCSTAPDLGDVAEICAPLVASSMPAEERLDRGSPKLDEFVYLMKSGKHYKIGRSNSVGRRTYEIGLKLAEPLTEVHHIATDDAVGIEDYWHRRFKSKEVNGEWFLLTPKDVAAFKRRRRFM
jgi:Meiotically up-regulated gene 113